MKISFVDRLCISLTVAVLISVLNLGCAATNTATTDATSGASVVENVDADIGDAIPPLDDNRRILVVFFSQGSSTRQVAYDLSAVTHGDIEEIKETKARRGFFGVLNAGRESTFKIASPILPGKLDPADYDVVYVCTPVWAWGLSPPVRAWLLDNGGSIRKAAFVAVSGNTNPDKIARDMARTGGIDPFVVVGFSQGDFNAENRARYEAKIAALIEPLR